MKVSRCREWPKEDGLKKKRRGRERVEKKGPVKGGYRGFRILSLQGILRGSDCQMELKTENQKLI